MPRFDVNYIWVFCRVWICNLWEWRCGGQSVWNPLPRDQQENGKIAHTHYTKSSLFSAVSGKSPTQNNESMRQTSWKNIRKQHISLTSCYVEQRNVL